jgi:hypothetical protein
VKLGRDGVMGWGGVFGVYPGIWGGVALVLGLDYPVKGAGGGCHGFVWSCVWKGLDFGQRLLAASIQVLPDRPYRRLSRQIATATSLSTCSHVEVISCLRSICSSFLPNDRV